MCLSYLLVQNTLEGCSNLSTKVSLDINSIEDSALQEINSEVELKEFITLGFLEEEEIHNSNKPGLEIEEESEFCITYNLDTLL